MKLWMSGEIQADVADYYRKASNAVEDQVNKLLNGLTLPEKIDEWDFVAIIREEDSPDYDEVVKKSSRGRSLEFRLKIAHSDFLSASLNGQRLLVLQALSRSVRLMEQLGVSPGTRDRLQDFLSPGR